jgi:hypothetical protein
LKGNADDEPSNDELEDGDGTFSHWDD